MSKILVIGGAGIDLILNMQRLPGRGETLVEHSPYCMTPGGHASNAAIALARLGGEPAICTRLGADSHGQRLITLYRDLGIDSRFVGIDKTHNTAFNVIMNDREGRRAVAYPGAATAISRDDLDEAFLCCPDGIYLQFDLPTETLRYAAAVAASKGIPIFVDATPAPRPELLPLLPQSEIFSPNQAETYAMTGVEAEGHDSCLRAAIDLSHRVKAKYYVLKLGSRGAFVYDGCFCHMCTAYPVRAVVDPTGAGDAFTAALTLEYLRNGRDILAACRYANAVGALTVQRPGAAASVPSREEVADFMRRNPIP